MPSLYVDVANAGSEPIDVFRVSLLTAEELVVGREPASLPRAVPGGGSRRFIASARPAAEESYVVLARIDWRAADGMVSTSDSAAIVFDVTGSPRR